MSRKYESNNDNTFGFSYNFSIPKPFDTREVVSTYNDLINPNTWKQGNVYVHYQGMKVSCADTGAIYVYIGEDESDTDVQNTEKWIAQGAGSLDVDLSDYYTKTETDSKLDKKLNNSDIAEWAKKGNKPTYTISEITGLENALSEKVNNNSLSTILLNELKNYTNTENLNSLLSNKLDIIKVSNITIEESGAFILSENNTRYQIINNSNSNYELTITKNLLNELFYIELVIKTGDTLPEITLPSIKWVKPIEFVEDTTHYIVIEKIGENAIGMWTAVSNN